MEEIDYRFLDEIISVGNVGVLVALWQLSFHQKEKGKQIRKYMKAALPTLCEGKGVPLTNSFREFVQAYDEKVYHSLCPRSSNYCLSFFAWRGDWRNLRIALKKGAVDFEGALINAARGVTLTLFSTLSGRREYRI